MIRALLAAALLGGCVQVVAPPPQGPGASLGALIDAAIAAQPPPPAPYPGEYVAPKPRY